MGNYRLDVDSLYNKFINAGSELIAKNSESFEKMKPIIEAVYHAAFAAFIDELVHHEGKDIKDVDLGDVKIDVSLALAQVYVNKLKMMGEFGRRFDEK